MNSYTERVSKAARTAAQARDWTTVRRCAQQILKLNKNSAEGHFLAGLAEKGNNRPAQAKRAFSKAIRFDSARYDAAVELAVQHVRLSEYGDAVALLRRYESALDNSPRYLEMAATLYVNAGLPDRAWPLYGRASELQPGVPSLEAKRAACSVFVGNITDAQTIYRELLAKAPGHQRNHYELSRLATATDDKHVQQMLTALDRSSLAPEKNIYLYYAIGKELEDLERWVEAFDYYRQAGDAASLVADYSVNADVELVDRILEVCDKSWLGDAGSIGDATDARGTPVFVVGLPRTGTTLAERILACHSSIESIGESFCLQRSIQRASRASATRGMTPDVISAAANANMQGIARDYLQAIDYRRRGNALFIEKFPENFLYLGFIARAFPNARIVLLNRNPMDTCFALFKQSFFRYAYSLDDVGRYYVAHHRLHEHWKRTLGSRVIELHYEELVTDQENQTRLLLERLGLPFETACLAFEKNATASNTASTVQIREKIHRRSMYRWKRFETQLAPLQQHLESAGIEVD